MSTQWWHWALDPVGKTRNSEFPSLPQTRAGLRLNGTKGDSHPLIFCFFLSSSLSSECPNRWTLSQHWTHAFKIWWQYTRVCHLVDKFLQGSSFPTWYLPKKMNMGGIDNFLIITVLFIVRSSALWFALHIHPFLQFLSVPAQKPECFY